MTATYQNAHVRSGPYPFHSSASVSQRFKASRPSSLSLLISTHAQSVSRDRDAALTCLCFGFLEHKIYTLPFLPISFCYAEWSSRRMVKLPYGGRSTNQELRSGKHRTDTHLLTTEHPSQIRLTLLLTFIPRFCCHAGVAMKEGRRSTGREAGNGSEVWSKRPGRDMVRFGDVGMKREAGSSGLVRGVERWLRRDGPGRQSERSMSK